MSKTTTSDLFQRDDKVAVLTNVGLAIQALNQINDSRDAGAPHMAVLYGPPGLGKTQAAMYLAHPAGRDAIFVSLRVFDTTKTFAQLICLELGVATKPSMSIGTLYALIVKRLTQLDRPLVIDEVDYIAEKTTIEFIRTIHDNTSVPIVLIGEQDLKSKLLNHHERFHDRVLVWCEAARCDASDVRKLATYHAPDLQLPTDVVEALVIKTQGVARRVYSELKALRQACLLAGSTAPTLAMLGSARPAKGAR